MTVKQGLRRIIFKKCAVLLVVAMLLGAMCYYTSSHDAVPNYNNMHFIIRLKRGRWNRKNREIISSLTHNYSSGLP